MTTEKKSNTSSRYTVHKVRTIWLSIGYGLVILVIFLIVCPFIVQLPLEKTRVSPQDIAQQLGSEGEFMEIGTEKIYVLDKGNKENPVVVLVHGFGGSTYSWRYVTPALVEAGFRVVAVDLRGFGLSQKGWNLDYSHGAQAELLHQVLEKKQIPDAHFIAHSLGVNVVFQYLQKYPQKDKKLVLIDGIAFGADEATQMEFPRILSQFLYTRQVARQVLQRAVNTEQVKKMIVSATEKDEIVTDEMVRYYAIPTYISGWDETLLGIVRDSDKNTTSPQAVSNITAKTLILWGEQDQWIPLQKGRELSAMIRESQFIYFPGVGHLPMEEQPDLVVPLIKEFLTEKKENS